MSLFQTTEFFLISVAFGIGSFGAVYLLVNAELRQRSWALAVFLVAGCVDQLDTLYLLSDGPIHIPKLVGLSFPATFLYGSSIYLYVRSMTAPAPLGVDRVAVLCLGLPLGGALCLLLPLYFLPVETKLAILAGEPVQSGTPTVAINLGILTLFFIMLAGFLVATWRRLRKNMDATRHLFSNLEHRTLAWLRFVFLLMVAASLWAASLEIWRSSDAAAHWHGLVNAGLAIAWTGALVFFGIEQKPTLEEASSEQIPIPPSQAPSPKYARSGLRQDRMERIALRLRAAMEEGEAFKDPQLYQRKLSDTLRNPDKHHSQTLNEHLGQNFFDFVNAYRVRAAKGVLAESAKPIVEIAFEVGFNSRSTFNAAFKKHTGHPPSYFRAPRP